MLFLPLAIVGSTAIASSPQGHDISVGLPIESRRNDANHAIRRLLAGVMLKESINFGCRLHCRES